MAKYAQIVGNKVHGIFEYDPLPEFAPNIVMVPIDGLSPQPKAGWIYNDAINTFSEPYVAPTDHGTKITRLALRNRFAFAEKVAIEIAAEASAPVRVLLKDLDSSTFVDLSRQDTIDGMHFLETEGLLGTGRADEILNATVQPHEVPS